MLRFRNGFGSRDPFWVALTGKFAAPHSPIINLESATSIIQSIEDIIVGALYADVVYIIFCASGALYVYETKVATALLFPSIILSCIGIFPLWIGPRPWGSVRSKANPGGLPNSAAAQIPHTFCSATDDIKH